MMGLPSQEAYVCVDVETSGPIPGDFSLLSIGACTVTEPQQTFYVELKPINTNLTAEAASVHKLTIDRLIKEGLEPPQAMTLFEEWLKRAVKPDQPPIFVAFNAVFDWMFIDYYFHHYLGRNPFGHAAIDIKAYYMGKAGVPWSQTSWRYIAPEYKSELELTHHALQDALDQAELFTKLLEGRQAK